MSIIAGFMVPHPPMIVPEVGRGSESVIQETTDAYKSVARQIAELKPDTIVISSPHSIMYADYFHISPGNGAKGSFADFRAPQVKMEVAYDEEFVSALCQEAEFEGISAGILGEKNKALDHGTMVPLYFILQEYTDFQLVRIGLSGLPLSESYRMGMAIGQVAKTLGRRTVYIASGDLSHKLKDDGPYGFDPAGPEYDDRIMDVMGRAAFEELLSFDEHFLEKCAECGHRSFVMMAGAFDRTDVTVKKFCHQDVTGVGYGICSYLAGGENDGRAFLDAFESKEQARREEQHRKEDLYVRLARRSLESYITGRQVIDWEAEKETLTGGMRSDRTADENTADPTKEIEESVDALSNTRAGAFVSLHKEGQLRGCIGTIAPTRENLAKEIIENAISAAVHDSRFTPVTEDELDKIEYSVDVLGEAEDIDSEELLDVKRYGVIVTKGYKRGLLLPNLDGVDTIEEQLSIAKRKAGLSPNEKGCSLQRFEVVRHY
ncbi:MAG: AmmeMemoRadiSam system protein A [Lachnospiraceae bacterium]|nr:AmmeMemoRadiSam system protein A [Lachnospiraceae bacterium]